MSETSQSIYIFSRFSVLRPFLSSAMHPCLLCPPFVRTPPQNCASHFLFWSVCWRYRVLMHDAFLNPVQQKQLRPNTDRRNVFFVFFHRIKWSATTLIIVHLLRAQLLRSSNARTNMLGGCFLFSLSTLFQQILFFSLILQVFPRLLRYWNIFWSLKCSLSDKIKRKKRK